MTPHELEVNRTYRHKHKDRLRIIARETARRYRQKNGEKVREYNKEYQKKYYQDHPYLSCLRGTKQRAKQAGIRHTLTREWAESVWTGHCAITGIPFEAETKGFAPMSPSIDRIVPSEGYVPENCRFILNCVNIFRKTLSDDKMVNVAREIVRALDGKTLNKQEVPLDKISTDPISDLSNHVC